MHLYLSYAREHWMRPDENPPVGLILCAEHRAGVARYALEGLPNKVLAAQYRTALPSEKTLAAELEAHPQDARSTKPPSLRKTKETLTPPQAGQRPLPGFATRDDLP